MSPHGRGKASLPDMNMDVNGSIGFKAGPSNICDSIGRDMLNGPISPQKIFAPKGNGMPACHALDGPWSRADDVCCNRLSSFGYCGADPIESDLASSTFTADGVSPTRAGAVDDMAEPS